MFRGAQRHNRRHFLVRELGVSIRDTVLSIRMGLGAFGLASLLACAPAAAQGSADAQAPKALGLIVKLKESEPQSVVRLQASAVPSDGAVSQRQRLYAASARTRVGFVSQRPTAYGAHVMHNGRVTSIEEAEAEAARLRRDPDVEWVVVNRYERPAALTRPNSAVAVSTTGNYNNNFWLKEKTSGDAGFGVAGFKAAWDRLQSPVQALGRVVVAVLDSGVLDAPEMTGRLLPGYDFVSQYAVSNDGDGIDGDPSDPGDYNSDPSLCLVDATSSWHGTNVTSLLTSPSGNTRLGPGALAALPGAVVLPVRVSGACGALVSDIVEGMFWAAGVSYQGMPYTNPNPARVVTLSYGGEGACLHDDNSIGEFYTNAIRDLRTRGAVFVASAGNGDGTIGDSSPTRPANCRGAVAATGLRKNGSKATYANLADGSNTALTSGYVSLAVASGDDNERIGTLANAGTQAPTATFFIGGFKGTSFAAPQVAAVAAMILAIDPSLTVQQVVDRMRTTATTHTGIGSQGNCGPSITGNCTCSTSTCGAGILDADAAVQSVQASVNPAGNDFLMPTVSADYFVPDRIRYNWPNSASSRSGGGGGALGVHELLALCGFLAAWTLRVRSSRG